MLHAPKHTMLLRMLNFNWRMLFLFIHVNVLSLRTKAAGKMHLANLVVARIKSAPDEDIVRSALTVFKDQLGPAIGMAEPGVGLSLI
jgi:hypothetical protein